MCISTQHRGILYPNHTPGRASIRGLCFSIGDDGSAIRHPVMTDLTVGLAAMAGVATDKIVRCPQDETPMSSIELTSKKEFSRLLLPVALCLVGGCYDGEALVKQAQSTALNTSLAEVDLGTYRTTLPRDPNTGRYIELELHIFGTVPRSRLSEVKKQLKADEYRVRHETLTAVRSSTREELADPKLAQAPSPHREGREQGARRCAGEGGWVLSADGAVSGEDKETRRAQEMLHAVSLSLPVSHSPCLRHCATSR